MNTIRPNLNCINQEFQANHWKKLKKLAGYTRNGTQTTIKLFQDDATHSCWIEVGEKSHYGYTFEEALDKFEVDKS